MGRHAEWRKRAKKCRRSRIRQAKALARETLLRREEEGNLKSSLYLTWKREQEALELFARVEQARIQEEENRKWIQREIEAQEEWRQTQEKIALFKTEKAKQELRIREEWDREQERIKNIEEKNRQEKEKREQRENEFKKRISDYIAGTCNELPDGFRCNIETKPGKELCPFFSKVGACRFFDNCSRNHIKPSVSKTLLLNNFFTHLSMENKSVGEYDTDMNLEFDDTDMYKFFLEFYDDVIPELRTMGELTQFKVCCNSSPHLKGNVYVSFSNEREALRAYYALTGRFYGGKRIQGQFCHVPLWSKAICGLFLRNKCPKRGICNFLHVFRNPTSEFIQADHDRVDRRSERCSNVTSSVRSSSSWAWSSNDSGGESDSENRSERQRRRKRRSSERKRRRSRSSERRQSSDINQSRSSERRQSTDGKRSRSSEKRQSSDRNQSRSSERRQSSDGKRSRSGDRRQSSDRRHSDEQYYKHKKRKEKKDRIKRSESKSAYMTSVVRR